MLNFHEGSYFVWKVVLHTPWVVYHHLQSLFIQELHWQLGSLDVSIHDEHRNPQRWVISTPNFSRWNPNNVLCESSPVLLVEQSKPSMSVASIPIFSGEIITVFSVKNHPFVVDPPGRWSWPTSACCCRCWMWIATPSARPGEQEKGTIFLGVLLWILWYPLVMTVT